jgi:integrase/recombinase XerD
VRTYLEPGEVDRMEAVATNQRDRLLVRLLFHLGCRISEALAIAVDDIDLERGTVTIQHLKCKMKLSCPSCSTRLGRCHSFCPRCGARVGEVVRQASEHRRVRTLPVDAETLDLITEYFAAGGPITKSGRAVLFGVNRHRAWQIVRECADRAGLPALLNPETGRVHGVSPHRLRDAFSVHAVKVDDSGDGLRLLQEHLGHQSITTTMRYRKVSGEEHKKWCDRLWGNKDNDSAGKT